MPVLQRQKLDKKPAFNITAKTLEPLYNELVDFAFDKRVTVAKAMTHIIASGLKAEKGLPYVPYAQEAEEVINR